MDWTQIILLYGPFDGVPMHVPDIQQKLEFRVGSTVDESTKSIICHPKPTTLYHFYTRASLSRFVYKGIYEKKPVEPLPGLEPL